MYGNSVQLRRILAGLLVCGAVTLSSCVRAGSNGETAAEGDVMSADTLAGEPADSLEGTRRVHAHLVLEAGALAPGNLVDLAVIFEIEPGWHLYWRNPGDSGLPPTIDLTLPAGITAGQPRWPAPHRELDADIILDYVFEDRLVVLIPLNVADTTPLGDARIDADLSWLVCQEVCVPGERTVSATFPVTRDPVRPFIALGDQEAIMEAVDRMPTDQAPPGFEHTWKGDLLTLRVPGADGLTFYPYESDAYVYPTDAIEHGEVSTDHMELTYPASVRVLDEVAGVLEVRHAGSATFHEVRIPVDE
ncbi:MAG: hypothetical protein KC729_00725 [Candidatus Eisenbacteria bacterium]|uniref:Thiol:disulfide interchange protein DsbD N-terminal domain-containing protein n=1 Tax=Eiseniibacteriota bacterium TaxID=2212470 RepID=A0A956RMY5_UNCEI|nr:hypothetical protein [Candidatus Eisenbacteria bacterium]